MARSRGAAPLEWPRSRSMDVHMARGAREWDEDEDEDDDSRDGGHADGFSVPAAAAGGAVRYSPGYGKPAPPSALTRLPTYTEGLLPSVQTLATSLASCLAVLAAGAACLAVAGYCLLAFLMVTRLYAPPALLLERPLYFDYTKVPAVAIAALPSEFYIPPDLPVGGPGLLPTLPSRVLDPAQRVSVQLQLEAPNTGGDEMYQVTGELLTVDGSVLARSTRSWYCRKHSPLARLVRFALTWPLQLLGLYDHYRHTKLRLMDSYIEREANPMMYVRANLTGAGSDGSVPKLRKAMISIRMHVGLIKILLFWACPGWVLTAVLAVWGLCMAVLGTTAAAALLLGAYLVYSNNLKASRAAAKTDGRSGGYAYGSPISLSEDDSEAGADEMDRFVNVLSPGTGGAAFGNGLGSDEDEEEQWPQQQQQQQQQQQHQQQQQQQEQQREGTSAPTSKHGWFGTAASGSGTVGSTELPDHADEDGLYFPEGQDGDEDVAGKGPGGGAQKRRPYFFTQE